ncbi:MAG: DUF2283 domain-containing protein [Methanosarcinales archaeon Met12]|nr:MAG: DUF2283 domain-containing protein [Methanosarcinales archaeon Met12]
MEEKLKFFLDEEGDVLDVTIGEPQPAISEEIGDDVIIHKNDQGEIVGFTILNFIKRFKKLGVSREVPVTARFVTA